MKEKVSEKLQEAAEVLAKHKTVVEEMEVSAKVFKKEKLTDLEENCDFVSKGLEKYNSLFLSKNYVDLNENQPLSREIEKTKFE